MKKIHYCSSIQDSILMPPPQAKHSISNISRSDTSEDLKRNLRVSSSDAYTNRKLHLRLFEDLKREDSLFTNRIPGFLKTSLKIINSHKQLNLCNEGIEECEFIIHKSPPKTPSEIISYVDHLFLLLKKCSFHSNLKLRIELETRFADYQNQALKADYFKDYIVKLQDKILASIQNAHNQSYTSLPNDDCRTLTADYLAPFHHSSSNTLNYQLNQNHQTSAEMTLGRKRINSKDCCATSNSNYHVNTSSNLNLNPYMSSTLKSFSNIGNTHQANIANLTGGFHLNNSGFILANPTQICLIQKKEEEDSHDLALNEGNLPTNKSTIGSSCSIDATEKVSNKDFLYKNSAYKQTISNYSYTQLTPNLKSSNNHLTEKEVSNKGRPLRLSFNNPSINSKSNQIGANSISSEKQKGKNILYSPPIV